MIENSRITKNPQRECTTLDRTRRPIMRLVCLRRSRGTDKAKYGAKVLGRHVTGVRRQPDRLAGRRWGSGFVGHTRGLSFVLQRDDILADDAAVAPKFGQVVALGENPGELHRALAAWAAGSVYFVVYIRHGQRAMLMKPQVKKGRSGGEPDRPIRALLRSTVVTIPRRG